MKGKKKFIYFFGGGKADGSSKMRNILGGKGADLAEMSNLKIPVPPGFTISTEVCHLFWKNNGNLPPFLMPEVKKAMKKLERMTGKKFGGSKNPLLVSVRSGAPVSMPGMMDTILNLGLNDVTLKALELQTGDRRFAYDSYRRFLMMFGDVVLKIPKEEFEKIFDGFKKSAGAKTDIEVSADILQDVVEEFKSLIKSKTKKDFPQDPYEQLEMAIKAVFLSWNNERAKFYRKQNNIPDDMGTAVNVQAMVFGNLGDDSATGVGFTRNPSTGEKAFYGEYLFKAQGEDVVAGVRTPKKIEEMKKDFPRVHEELLRIAEKLEKHYRDIQDIEFTIERGKLYLLQTRSGKRTARAAVKIAVDMVKENLITKEEAIMRVNPYQLNQLLHPVVSGEAKYTPIATGLGASPGAAVGKVVFDAETAVQWAARNERVILVRKETSPDDIHGMDAAEGILTQRGGMTSHAAVVARHMGKPCVVGCEALDIDEGRKRFKVKDKVINEGDYITIDGETGEVILGELPLIPPQITGEFKEFMTWADSFRRLKVRANADTPSDAKLAREMGAEGIGLCRTEHMFFAEERIPVMQGMILADTREEREKFLSQLEEMQVKDFEGIFEAMDGLPVTIRLLDPPLHEFLPSPEELKKQLARLQSEPNPDEKEIARIKKMLQRTEEMKEFNPMLGLRGVRLGLLYPEIYQMQVRAIINAALRCLQKKIKVYPEIMIPLVANEREMEVMREMVKYVADGILKKKRVNLSYSIGTMIELPRAALMADKIARSAEFFSFGTNDLTQTTYGFSRDDAGKIIKRYLDYSMRCTSCGGELNGNLKCKNCGRKYPSKPVPILQADPFHTLDREGVGELMKIAVEKGKTSRPSLKIGICGEHGGDPPSVEFCHFIGLDYVSCSPYRIPIARLSAAQAAIREKREKGKVKMKKPERVKKVKGVKKVEERKFRIWPF